MANEEDPLFWEVSEPLLSSGVAERGTMMGYPCLRTEGKFFASLEKNSGNLIVKLPAQRVNELIDLGQAHPFAPNGRVFREWALIDRPDREQWTAFLQEAVDFVKAS
jgi:hypothetical protein